MANIPNKAVKKIKNDVHREIAAGILIAYGLFPRTNEGIAAAQRLIAGRETWLAPSDLPNYYDNIESDLMTGKETPGIRNIRMLLKEFYGLDDKPSATTLPKLNTGKTTVYKPEDKLVDDITENLEKKLEETSNDIMDVVDALIEKQKKDFEDFKRKQEEERKQKKSGENQYPAPIGPDPVQGPKEPPVQGPKKPPKKTVAPEKDEDWESEVPDQLGTKLDELIDQVKNDPLPQPTKTKRRKTKGKKSLERKSARMDAKEMGVGASLTEIMTNVVETREALFDLYKVTKERFEFKKKIDKRLTAALQAKLREKQIEGGSGEDDPSKLKPVDEDKKKKKPGMLKKSLIDGLIGGAIMMTLPLIIEGLRPFMTRDRENEGDNQWWDFLDVFPNEIKEDLEKEPPLDDAPAEAPTSIADQSGGLGNPDPEPPPPSPAPAAPSPAAPVPAPAAPSITPFPVRDTSIPGDSGYQKPQPMPLRAAAKGGKFTKGDHKPLRPISAPPIKNPVVKRLTKPLSSAITLPQKVAAAGVLSFANSILSPFSAFLPDSGKQFIKNIYNEVAKSSGLSGMNLQLNKTTDVFEKVKKFLENIVNSLLGGAALGATTPPGGNTPAGNTPGGNVSVTDDEEEYLMRLMIAEAGGEGKLGMAAVAKSVMNRAGLIQSGKVGAGTFLADSGSVKDVINAENQYQPVRQGKLNRNLSDEERKRAKEALSLARDGAGMREALKAEGMSQDQINKVMASTGFRTGAAFNDASQNVNNVKLGSHVFNTAGNKDLLSLGANINTPEKVSGLTATAADKEWYEKMMRSGKDQTPPGASPRRNMLQQLVPFMFPPPAPTPKPELPVTPTPSGRRAPQQPGS